MSSIFIAYGFCFIAITSFSIWYNKSEQTNINIQINAIILVFFLYF